MTGGRRVFHEVIAGVGRDERAPLDHARVPSKRQTIPRSPLHREVDGMRNPEACWGAPRAGVGAPPGNRTWVTRLTGRHAAFELPAHTFRWF